MVIGSFANGLNKNNPRENELYVGIMTGDLPTQAAIYEKVLSLYSNDVKHAPQNATYAVKEICCWACDKIGHRLGEC